MKRNRQKILERFSNTCASKETRFCQQSVALQQFFCWQRSLLRMAVQLRLFKVRLDLLQSDDFVRILYHRLPYHRLSCCGYSAPFTWSFLLVSHFVKLRQSGHIHDHFPSSPGRQLRYMQRHTFCLWDGPGNKLTSVAW